MSSSYWATTTSRCGSKLPQLHATHYDDYANGYSYYGYNDDGDLLIIANHRGAGFDGEWFTADDLPAAPVTTLYRCGQRYRTVNGMGPDGKWLSGDDNIYGYSYRMYDDANNELERADFSSKGADGLWFTSDDLPTASYNYLKYERDTEGRVLKQFYYDPARDPNAPAFSDSQIYRYKVYSADFSNSLDVGTTAFGNDDIPLTEDDTAIATLSPQTQATTSTINRGRMLYGLPTTTYAVVTSSRPSMAAASPSTSATTPTTLWCSIPNTPNCHRPRIAWKTSC